MEGRNQRSSKIALRVLLVALGGLLAFEAYVWTAGSLREGSFEAYLETRRASSDREFAQEVINRYYVDGPVLEGEAKGTISSMVSGLDAYSGYLDENQTKWLREETGQEFGGIGVRIDTSGGYLAVLAPMEGTPGERAGLRRGDRIVEIDGRPVEADHFELAIEGLRGRPGTKVSLGVSRPSTGDEFDLLIERAVIPVPSVRDGRLMRDGVGYVRVEQFGARTAEELRSEIDRLLAEGMTRLVLDLRGNPGGLLDAAVEVASSFLERGQLVVSLKGREGVESERREARRWTGRYDFPVVALVNRGTASAAEIVAGALRDWKRATLVGQKTFGKGSVQSIIELSPSESIRLTTARYYTPGGYVIDGVGLEPDVVVELERGEARRLAHQRRRLEYVSAAEYEGEFGSALEVDRQLEKAVEVVLGL